MKTNFTRGLATVAMLFAVNSVPAQADGDDSTKPGGAMMGMEMMSTGLILPRMDSAAGRQLFASKGCVVCHSINGVGGEDAPMLDANLMDTPMNPFEFAAKMWRGAPAMVAMQEGEMGGQIEFTGEELANIIAFVHDPAEQAKFSKADIPEAISKMMSGME